MTSRPYRANVGAVLFNRDGLVFVARRADLPNAEGAPGGWQLPQGGIEPDEEPRERAVLRELAEEIGTDRAEILDEYPQWLDYDFRRQAWLGDCPSATEGSGSAGSRCALPAATRISGLIVTRIRNSMHGAGHGCPSCRRWRSISSGRSMKFWRACSRISPVRIVGTVGNDELVRFALIESVTIPCRGFRSSRHDRSRDLVARMLAWLAEHLG